MKDDRLKKLAKSIIEYSLEVKAGEKVLINCTVDELPLVNELIDCVYSLKAYPFINLTNNVMQKELLKGFTEEQGQIQVQWEELRMNNMDAYVSIATAKNPSEYAELSTEKLNIYAREVSEKANKKMRDGRLRWTVAIYPTPFYANLAGMSLDAFEDYYFKVCCLDYKKLGDAMDKLVDKMKIVDKVRIVSKDTDISFSIKGIEVSASKGDRNIPDGEVYTAPVLESVNGIITYNTPSVYQGIKFEKVCFEFKDGKIIRATANETEKLNEILDADEGARYIGEFAIGVNPYIMHPMNNTLFDEKINGSIHLTPGFSLDLASNGNKSSIHWDLVLIQRPEYGGGEIYFDNELVRKDGLFILPELQCINPENF